MLFVIKKYSRIFLMIIVFISNPSKVLSDPLPQLGDPYSEVLPISNEEIIGFMSYQSLQNGNYIINDPLVVSYINYLGNLLSRNLLDEKRKYKFFIVDTDDINAFALPGGYIGINSGLVLLSKNEAQLASVLAHEISHVNLRHIAEMLASSTSNSIPMWIGILAGMFTGNAQASMAAIQAGLGISMQQNINLIRSNEVEADNLAIEIIKSSPFKTSAFSDFFGEMMNATGDVQRSLSYLSTHPMFEERIANIKNRTNINNSKIINTTDDYKFIKNILYVKYVKDINRQIKNIKSDSVINKHRIGLLYNKKSDYEKSINVIKDEYLVNSGNIYITVLYADNLLNLGKVDEAIITLEKLSTLHPLNKNLPLIISEIMVDNNQNPTRAVKLLSSVSKSHSLNPIFYRTLSKAFSLNNDIFNSNINLAEYYVIIGNYRLAIEVLQNASRSNKLSAAQLTTLNDKKRRILCTYNRPLEPIFGEKTCN